MHLATVAVTPTGQLDVPVWSANAEEPTLRGLDWIAAQWERARIEVGGGPGILVIDEVQKAEGWAESVKQLWDEDTAADRELKVVLVGSAPRLIEEALTERLHGHFEILRLGCWTYPEMRDAFGWNLDHYVYFGGYPGAAPLVDDEGRWRRYVLDSIIETTIARDVLLLTRVHKPALLRRLFELSCRCSGQIHSYNRMLEQLPDAGNTTTLSHYLDLLERAGMVRGLPKYSGEVVRRRGSSPKLQVFDPALMSAQSGLGFDAACRDRAYWGTLVESAVGAHLANAAAAGAIDLHYWRDRNHQMDFVVSSRHQLFGIVVKSVRRLDSPLARIRFTDAFNAGRVRVVGPTGTPLERFLSTDVAAWMG